MSLGSHDSQGLVRDDLRPQGAQLYASHPQAASTGPEPAPCRRGRDRKPYRFLGHVDDADLEEILRGNLRGLGFTPK